MSSVTNLMRCSPDKFNIPLLNSEIIFRHGKQVNPLRKPNAKEKLIFFNVIWSNDKNLLPAYHIGFPSNKFGEFCYRIQPQNPNEEGLEYTYIISSKFAGIHYKVINDEIYKSIKELLKTTKI